MPTKSRYRTRLPEKLSRFSPTPESPARSRQRTLSKNKCAASDEVDSDDATGSDFVPDQQSVGYHYNTPHFFQQCVLQCLG
ncbi:hypothetical protein B0H14DRAFT_3509126 [Mycena olivaceomarginata]|nr:hypothetical protein B0H14DRAFT_3509126 [Mycena olivaceomarginata]